MYGLETNGNSMNFECPWLCSSIWSDDDDEAINRGVLLDDLNESEGIQGLEAVANGSENLMAWE